MPKTGLSSVAGMLQTAKLFDALADVAHRHGLKLIFDAAHGFGALYQGEPVGKQADAHIFSLQRRPDDDEGRRSRDRLE